MGRAFCSSGEGAQLFAPDVESKTQRGSTRSGLCCRGAMTEIDPSKMSFSDLLRARIPAIALRMRTTLQQRMRQALAVLTNMGNARHSLAHGRFLTDLKRQIPAVSFIGYVLGKCHSAM